MPPTDSPSRFSSLPLLRRLGWISAVLLIFALGISLRVFPFAAFKGTGFDEALYNVYTTQLLQRGLTHYPSIVTEYIDYQKTLTGSILPPMRFLYIGTSALWSKVTGVPPLNVGIDGRSGGALYQVASCFSVLTLFLTFGFMYRLAGRGAALAVTAMMACAPTQIHMAQHALVDGFFTFWALLALWLLWENLQRPRNPALLIAYTLGLALLVTTKENAAFVLIAFVAILITNRWFHFGTVNLPLVYAIVLIAFTLGLALLVTTKANVAFFLIALVAILITNRWFHFGTVNRPLVYATVLGPILGALVLMALAGGLDNLVACYNLSVSKNYTLEYAIKTGDGPWYRYLVDLMLVSPFVLILAVGAFFQLDRERFRPQLFVAVFISVSYLVMCNLKYGMNLRYANMWDAPLRLLAFMQLGLLADRFGGRWRNFWLVAAVIFLCGYDIRQYHILAIEYDHFYEMVTGILLQALHILK